MGAKSEFWNPHIYGYLKKWANITNFVIDFGTYSDVFYGKILVFITLSVHQYNWNQMIATKDFIWEDGLLLYHNARNYVTCVLRHWGFQNKKNVNFWLYSYNVQYPMVPPVSQYTCDIVAWLNCLSFISICKCIYVATYVKSSEYMRYSPSSVIRTGHLWFLPIWSFGLQAQKTHGWKWLKNNPQSIF